MSKFYSGIGSRRTPPEVLEQIIKIGAALAKEGYTLRSGAADGADAYFEKGCDTESGPKEIWLPWKGFNKHISLILPKPIHFEKAGTVHPAWVYLTNAVKCLHARNIGQVLGGDVATPVEFVICYTPDGAESSAEVTKSTGGTGTAIRLASDSGIPVINLAKPDALERLKSFLKGEYDLERANQALEENKEESTWVIPY